MKINTTLATLPAGYLFAEIAKRVKEYATKNPDADILRLGIGDVTRPLVPAVVEEMKRAAAEMGTPEGFHGYGPDFGYDFLIDAIIAGDYTARGIDVDDVEAVINYDLPNENEYYLHRIGRTGRAHKHGVSFSLVTFRESIRMDEILKYMLTVPTPLKFEDGVLCREDGTPFFENI